MKKRLVISPIFLMLLLLAACTGQESEGTPPPELTATAIPQDEKMPETTPADGANETGATESEAIISTRPPEPTATPGPLTRQVNQFVLSTDLRGTTFLGLSAADWINLAISLLIIVFAFLIGMLLTRTLIRWVVRRTSPEFGDVLQKSIGPRLKWLIVIPALYFATIRLDFLSSELKNVLADVYFILLLLYATLIGWTLIDVVYEHYRQSFATEERGEQPEPILLLLKRLVQSLVIALVITILFSHFGVNITALLAGLGILGLAFSLAAQDTLSDAISGFVILVDQPYRIGDRIEIQGENTWGDVVEIGLRTTRIRTLDNRMAIVPNSIISNSQVINYTFPDPRYRIQTHISIAYGSDIERVRELIVETVSKVEGVLPDKPVDSLYIEMGDSAMIFRVRWWLGTYADTRRMFDQVNTALQNVFDANGIDMPYPIHTTKLEVDDKTASLLMPSR
jgi:small-conductance mechanosensitive channel